MYRYVIGGIRDDLSVRPAFVRIVSHLNRLSPYDVRTTPARTRSGRARRGHDGGRGLGAGAPGRRCPLIGRTPDEQHDRPVRKVW